MINASFRLVVFFLWTGIKLALFPSKGNFPLSVHDFNISYKGFRIDSPQILNTRKILIMSLWAIWIKIFHDFRNVIFSKRDHRNTAICSFNRISRKFASIVDSALFSKEIVKDLSFVFEISNLIIIMINWWNARYFFIIYKRFHYRPLCLRACSGIH